MPTKLQTKIELSLLRELARAREIFVGRRETGCWSILVLALIGNCLFQMPVAHGQSVPKQPIEIATARDYFSEAAAMFERDGGELWGESLAGPIMFVDRDSHIAIANQADLRNSLIPVEGVFTGRLPSTLMIANTAIDWNETKWTMVLWPLPEDADERRILLAHEAWHRVQDKFGFPSSGASNDHLNSFYGRYLLQLEWRALGAALRSEGAERIAAIADALHFRHYRHQLSPGCEAEERSMEMHEGLAEYTGVRLALDPAKRIARTISELQNRPAQLETFVRSFAYLSGPAYGLLLDELVPEWLGKAAADSDLAGLLQEAAEIDVEVDLKSVVTDRALKYDGEALWATEKTRDDERLAQIELLKKKYTEGPRLIIPIKSMNMSFNPNELVPLGESGTYYPTLTITDTWGVLKVTGGAVIASGFQEVIVSVPADYANSLKTPDWELELNEGWSIKAGGDGVFKAEMD